MADICDHEFDGEHCEECGIHVSEYIDALRERIGGLQTALENMLGVFDTPHAHLLDPTPFAHEVRKHAREALAASRDPEENPT